MPLQRGTLRVYLIASSVREVVGELETEQIIEKKEYSENGMLVECALCYGDRIILRKYEHGVVMEYMDNTLKQELPAGINPSRISAITLSGVILAPDLVSARYIGEDRLTYAWSVRHLSLLDAQPDASHHLTLSWKFLTKSEQIGHVFDLLQGIEDRQIAPKTIDGIDYAAGATLERFEHDEVVTHVLEGIEPLQH